MLHDWGGCFILAEKFIIYIEQVPKVNRCFTGCSIQKIMIYSCDDIQAAKICWNLMHNLKGFLVIIDITFFRSSCNQI